MVYPNFVFWGFPLVFHCPVNEGKVFNDSLSNCSRNVIPSKVFVCSNTSGTYLLSNMHSSTWVLIVPALNIAASNQFCGVTQGTLHVCSYCSYSYTVSIHINTCRLVTRIFGFLIWRKILHFNYKNAVKRPIYLINWLMNCEASKIKRIQRF